MIEAAVITRTVCAVAATALIAGVAGAISAAPLVSDNIISWTDEGWHQVQSQADYSSVCQAGRASCFRPIT